MMLSTWPLRSKLYKSLMCRHVSVAPQDAPASHLVMRVSTWDPNTDAHVSCNAYYE